MIKKVLVVLLSFICLTTMAGKPKTHLVVWLNDGTKVMYLLAEKPQIRFTQSALVIIKNDEQTSYSLDKMLRFTYESLGGNGDVNSDGKVNIVDVTITINHILKQNPSYFSFEAADVNGDKKIDYLDIKIMTEIIYSSDPQTPPVHEGIICDLDDLLGQMFNKSSRSIINVEKFLRYQMNNNTYNGFYTWGIESILHDYKNGIATTFVNASGKTYEIPIEDIDCISVEDANISNDNIGQYRIYEFNYEEGDIKKIFVDNRASLFASHNGDFGANDTILFSSAYNDITWIFYTDDQGRIKKYFDGNSLLFIDYDSDDEFTVLDLLSNTTNHYNLTSSQARSLSRAPSFSGISRFVRSVLKQIGTPEGQQAGQSAQSALQFAKNLEDVQNNPELHNQLLSSDWGSIGLDMLNIGASIVGGIPTGGASLAGFGLSVGSLLNDIVGLINDTWPDSEQMQRYRDYYQNKYSIHVAAIAPENVSYTSATLRGEATSLEGLNGTFLFSLYGENDETLSGTKNNVTNNSCIITANASKLKPGSPYFYSVQYTCVVDGLQLVFYADNIAEFMTLSPTVYTGEVHSKSSDRAEVVCQFYNVPKGSSCGVEYSCSDDKAEKRTNSTSDGVKYFTLFPLKANTTYTYRAFVDIDGIYVYAEDSKQFKTDGDGLCPDSNHPHLIDLGIGTKWACCNIGATSPSECGGYYAWGELAEKTNYSWETYIYFRRRTGKITDIGSDIHGNSQYDVATKWGDGWHIPTKEQCDKLIDECFYKWTSYNGVWGAMFTGNGNRIFIPAGGQKVNSYLADKGGFGLYWSSTEHKTVFNNANADALLFDSNGVVVDLAEKGLGFLVRPVK